MCLQVPPSSLLVRAERPVRKGQHQTITPGATAPLQPLHSLAGPEASGLLPLGEARGDTRKQANLLGFFRIGHVGL